MLTVFTHEPMESNPSRCRHCKKGYGTDLNYWGWEDLCQVRAEKEFDDLSVLLYEVSRALVVIASGQRTLERMMNPVPGDLVMVLGPDLKSIPDSMGFLTTTWEWDEEDDEEPPNPDLCPVTGDKVHTIRRLNGNLRDWFNATVWAIPRDL